MRGVLQDAWYIVDEQDRELLCQVAAFPRSFDIYVVEGVADDVEAGTISRGVRRLVDRSLIVGDGSGRLQLLETVKFFASPAARLVRRLTSISTPTGACAPCARTHTRRATPRSGWPPGYHDTTTTCAPREEHLLAVGRTADVVDLLGLQSVRLADLAERLGPDYDSARVNHDLLTAAVWIVDAPERARTALSSLTTAYKLADHPYANFVLSRSGGRSECR